MNQLLLFDFTTKKSYKGKRYIVWKTRNTARVVIFIAVQPAPL